MTEGLIIERTNKKTKRCLNCFLSSSDLNILVTAGSSITNPKNGGKNQRWNDGLLVNIFETSSVILEPPR